MCSDGTGPGVGPVTGVEGGLEEEAAVLRCPLNTGSRPGRHQGGWLYGQMKTHVYLGSGEVSCLFQEPEAGRFAQNCLRVPSMVFFWRVE